MPSLGPMEIILIILVIVILFGWNKLPDAARSLGRSMRIFKSEVEEMKKDKPSSASRETVPGTTVPPTEGAPPAYPQSYPPAQDPNAYRPQYQAPPAQPQSPPPSYPPGPVPPAA